MPHRRQAPGQDSLATEDHANTKLDLGDLDGGGLPDVLAGLDLWRFAWNPYPAEGQRLMSFHGILRRTEVVWIYD